MARGNHCIYDSEYLHHVFLVVLVVWRNIGAAKFHRKLFFAGNSFCFVHPISFCKKIVFQNFILVRCAVFYLAEYFSNLSIRMSFAALRWNDERTLFQTIWQDGPIRGLRQHGSFTKL